MSVKTGLHRIAVVLKGIGVLSVLGGVAGAISEGGEDGIAVLLSLGVIGGVFGVLGWVLDGFAKE